MAERDRRPWAARDEAVDDPGTESTSARHARRGMTMGVADGVVMHGRKLAFSHLGLSCFDLDRMEAFYTQVLGLTVTDRGYVEPLDLHIVFMTTDAADHHQFVLASNRQPGPVETSPVMGGSVGSTLFQASFRVADLATLRTIKRRIEDAGIDNIVTVSHGNAWAMYTRDPEGNALEFFVDSPWFVNQPCLEPIDLDQSDDEILQATEALCRSMQGFEPYSSWRERAQAVILADQARIV